MDQYLINYIEFLQDAVDKMKTSSIVTYHCSKKDAVVAANHFRQCGYKCEIRECYIATMFALTITKTLSPS